MLALGIFFNLLHHVVVTPLIIALPARIVVLAYIAMIARTNNGLNLALITHIILMDHQSVVDFIDQLVLAALLGTLVRHPAHIGHRIPVDLDTGEVQRVGKRGVDRPSNVGGIEGVVLGGRDPVTAPIGLTADMKATVIDSASDGLLLLAIKLPAKGVDLSFLPLEQSSNPWIGLIRPKLEPNNKLEELDHIMIAFDKPPILTYLTPRVHMELVVTLKGIKL